MSNDDIINRLERIEQKQDVVQEHMTEMLVVLTKNTSDVAYHIKRSDQTDAVVQIMDARLQKVEETDKKVMWTISVIVGLAAVATFLKEMGLI